MPEGRESSVKVPSKTSIKPWQDRQWHFLIEPIVARIFLLSGNSHRRCIHIKEAVIFLRLAMISRGSIRQTIIIILTIQVKYLKAEVRFKVL